MHSVFIDSSSSRLFQQGEGPCSDTLRRLVGSSVGGEVWRVEVLGPGLGWWCSSFLNRYFNWMAELPVAGRREGALVLLISSLTQGYTWEHQTPDKLGRDLLVLIVCTSLRILFYVVMASQENKALCLDKIHVCLLRGSLCVLISPLSEGCSVHSANIFTLSIISHTATNSQK